MLRKHQKGDNLLRQSPAMLWCSDISFARCATACSASAHIAHRTRSNVITATRATRSHGTICIYLVRNVPLSSFNSVKISTFYSYFLVSYNSLKQTDTFHTHTHTHTHTYIYTHTHCRSFIYMYKPKTYMPTDNYCQ